MIGTAGIHQIPPAKNLCPMGVRWIMGVSVPILERFMPAALRGE
jgi:hypothetical protein